VDAQHEPEDDHERAVGRRYPLAVKLRIGAQLAAGVPPGGVKLLAESLGVTTRTLLEWKKLALLPESERPKVGRPRVPAETRASLRMLILAVQEQHHWRLSGRGVHRLLDKRAPLGRVQEVMRVVRAQRARHLRDEAELRRAHVHALARDTVWSLDGTHLGRDVRGGKVIAELVRDVTSTKTLGVAIGPPPTSGEVVLLLTRIALVGGVLPLVLASDNGGENRGELEEWCAANQVLHLKNLPRTPQHNPWVEHGNGELKAQTGLGKGARINSVSETAAAVLEALEHLDGVVLRPTRGERTAREVYAALPAAETLVDRAELFDAAHCAIAEAVEGCRTARERRLAERKALLATLERYELITQTRGPMPQPGRGAEGIS
jgi:hypothetical protein